MLDNVDLTLDNIIENYIYDSEQARWRVMIMDEDPHAHSDTKSMFNGFSFMGRGITWVDAYSLLETQKILERDHEFALLFLNISHNSEKETLSLIAWFRGNDINKCTRIILRTNHMNGLSSQKIILKYDIHDFRATPEPSESRLFTTTVAALRAYDDIRNLERTLHGLESIIKSSSAVFSMSSIDEYAADVLKKIGSVLRVNVSGVICARERDGEWEIIARQGELTACVERVFEALSSEKSEDPRCVVKTFIHSADMRYAMYLEPERQLTDVQVKLLNMFCNNASVIMSNITLYESLSRSHKATVMSLAQVTEFRDKSTGMHTSRISNAVETLAKELFERGIYPDEIDEKLISAIGMAAILHDVGKIAVPDHVLFKPGPLTSDELEIIRKHSSTGAELLQSTIDRSKENVEYLEIGKQIALYHHERWDGKGYPKGLKGREIPVAARITAIVDVFDALVHKRCYKEAMPFEEALDIIKNGRETSFDPQIADIFLDIYDKFYTRQNRENKEMKPARSHF